MFAQQMAMRTLLFLSTVFAKALRLKAAQSNRNKLPVVFINKSLTNIFYRALGMVLVSFLPACTAPFVATTATHPCGSTAVLSDVLAWCRTHHAKINTRNIVA